MLLCECLSVLAGHYVVWLSDSHSLKVWLFVSNLFATPGLDCWDLGSFGFSNRWPPGGQLGEARSSDPISK